VLPRVTTIVEVLVSKPLVGITLTPIRLVTKRLPRITSVVESLIAELLEGLAVATESLVTELLAAYCAFETVSQPSKKTIAKEMVFVMVTSVDRTA
jgi:hypothetical protein